MNIFDLEGALDETDVLHGTRFSRDTGRGSEEEYTKLRVASEHFVDVYVNNILTMKLVCTPSCLTELVLGRLFTEGMIGSTDDVDSIFTCHMGTSIKVILKKKDGVADGSSSAGCFVDTTGTCCTGNHLLTDVFSDAEPPAPIVPIKWRPEWIYGLAERFAESTELFEATHSIHSCYLAKGDQLLYCCEDIGRHNAIDKAIGRALMDGVDLHECIVFTSGRVPTDMVAKVIRAGIPVLISKSVCTDRGAELAREFGLTLICFARPDHFTLMK